MGVDKDLGDLIREANTGEAVFDSIEDLKDPQKIDKAVRRAVENLRPKATELWRNLNYRNRHLADTIQRMASDDGIELQTFFIEWLVQHMLFLEIGKNFKLEVVTEFPEDRKDGFMALTQRGSILIVGHEKENDGRRPVEYIRIDSRKASWNAPTSATAEMERDVRVGEQAGFTRFITTSPIDNILVLPADRPKEELVAIRRNTLQSIGAATRVRPVKAS